jgi:hypothetical protein
VPVDDEAAIQRCYCQRVEAVGQVGRVVELAAVVVAADAQQIRLVAQQFQNRSAQRRRRQNVAAVVRPAPSSTSSSVACQA